MPLTAEEAPPAVSAEPEDAPAMVVAEEALSLDEVLRPSMLEDEAPPEVMGTPEVVEAPRTDALSLDT